MAIAQLPPFAKLLRRHRMDAILTQEELAERAGLSARAISDLERGVKTRPHRVTIEALADALNLAADERARLLGAVRRITVSEDDSHDVIREQLAEQPLPLQAQTVRSSNDLRRILDGLVGFYIDAEERDEQINVAVIVFSTEKA